MGNVLRERNNLPKVASRGNRFSHLEIGWTLDSEFDRTLDLPEKGPSPASLESNDTDFTERDIAAVLEYGSQVEEGFDEPLQHLAAAVETTNQYADYASIGPYKIVDLIGHGGMGCVYLADRADGEIQQRVAVKLLRSDDHRPAWRERFLRERQLLASLHHPSIVHVIDAGHTENARPYLVMEYVQGVPIDVYSASINVTERLELFLRVCEGVSHAHRCLIIHRDLKPSNILVDASGQPKLLDFGIAKLLDDAGDATQTEERLLTPKYASPEQLAGGTQTTATDIYSLGVVLYNILTGVGPHDNNAGAPRGNIVSPSQLNSEVRPDVDFIVRKALRPEPEDRYASVDEFAKDIRAALEWRPVQARSGDAWYRSRRFLRRFWIPVAAAFLVVASLSTALYVANRQRVLAERHFADIRQLSSKLFDIDVQVAQLYGGSKTRQLIVDTALDYLRRVTSRVRKDPALTLEVGTAYMRVARVQGVNISPNLGQTSQAIETEKTAQALIESVLAAQPTNRTALLRAAQIAHDRMVLAGDGHHDEEALAFARKSVDRLEQYLKTGELNANSDRREAQQVIIAYINAANKFMAADQFDEALRLCQRAITIARATNWPTQAAAALINVALNNRAMGNLDEALKAIHESAQILKPAAGEESTGRMASYALALLREGQILGEDSAISLGRPKEALEYMQQALTISLDFANRDSSDFQSQYKVFLAETKMAGILSHTEPRRALEMYDDGLQRLARTKANAGARRNQIKTLAASTYPLQQLGRAPEARRRLDAAFALLSELKLYPAKQIEPGSETSAALRALADYEAGNANVQRAAELYQELLDRIAASHPNPETSLADAVDLSNIYEAAAPVDRRAGLAARATELDARRLELWRHWDQRLPNNVLVLRQLDAARRHAQPALITRNYRVNAYQMPARKS